MGKTITILTCGHTLKRVSWFIKYYEDIIDFNECKIKTVTIHSSVCPNCYRNWKRRKCFISGEKIVADSLGNMRY